jgi:hypothetical protein
MPPPPREPPANGPPANGPPPGPAANPTPEPIPPYDRDAIFHDYGPFNPSFMREAVRTLMRTLPLDPAEPQGWQDRRMHSALLGLSALHPRDEIEVMLGVQAMAAYHAAAACWHIGMNLRRPNGDSTRHITTAASAARVFDSLLRAIERRQAKPLSIPIGRPPPQVWISESPTRSSGYWRERCSAGETGFALHGTVESQIVWTEEDRVFGDEFLHRRQVEQENEGLDIANTEGILPGGGMILMDDPTPQQSAYMARRIGLQVRRQRQDDLRNGIDRLPPIRPIRPGDLIP